MKHRIINNRLVHLLAFAALGTGLLAGCTSTRIHSLGASPNSHRAYRNVLFIADLPNAEDRSITETEYLSVFGQGNIEIASLSSIPIDLSTMSDEDVKASLIGAGIDGVLILSFSVLQSDYPTDSLLEISGSRTKLDWRKSVAYVGNESSTFPRISYSLGNSSVTFTMRLYDQKTGGLRWIAASTTKGLGIGSFRGVMRSQAEALLQELATEEVMTASN